MEFLSVRELSKSPKVAFDKLTSDGKAVIINNGQPKAILVKVDASSFENTLSLLQKLECMQNLTEMRLASLRNGNSKLSLGEINAEIAPPALNSKTKIINDKIRRHLVCDAGYQCSCIIAPFQWKSRAYR